MKITRLCRSVRCVNPTAEPDFREDTPLWCLSSKFPQKRQYWFTCLVMDHHFLYDDNFWLLIIQTSFMIMQIAKRYCHNCTFLDPIAVPIIIHRNDLAKIAPLWLEKTLEIRRDMNSWPNLWKNRSLSNVGLSWTAEMFGWVCDVCSFLHTRAVKIVLHNNAEVKSRQDTRSRTVKHKYLICLSWFKKVIIEIVKLWPTKLWLCSYVFAASELGIRHDIWDLQSIPGYHKTLLTPIIHYHIEVELPNGVYFLNPGMVLEADLGARSAQILTFSIPTEVFCCPDESFCFPICSGKKWYKHKESAGYEIPWPVSWSTP